MQTILLSQHASHDLAQQAIGVHDAQPLLQQGSVIQEVEVAADLPQAGMPQMNLGTFPAQIFWLALTFVFLLVVMKFRLIPRIEDVLENRQSRIRQDLERASEMQKEAELIRQDYEASLAAARQQSAEVYRVVEQKITRLQDDRTHKLEQSLKKQLDEASKRIENAKQSALSATEVKARELAKALSQKLGAEASDSDIDTAFKQVKG